VDYIYIGSSPSEEKCEQAGSPLSRAECKIYCLQLERELTAEMARRGLDRAAHTVYFSVKAESHDFGTYHEAVCKYDDTDEVAVDLALWAEGNTSPVWDAEARSALKHMHEQAGK
jgi:hypothetical protein